MLFNSAQFAGFLAIALLAFYAAPAGARKWLLLAASYLFYMAWNPRYIVLLLALTVIDYVAALWLGKAEGRHRKVALLCSLAANLGFLAYFKYFGFFTGTAPTDIVLPLGISFHTFQSISYVIDVYRREQAPVRNLLDYALFIAFFPQLVAGPIVRAGEFFADLIHWKHPTAEEVRRGALLVLFGLMKKTIAADHFAEVANGYFQNPAAHSGALPAWGGVLAFALQIFFDFSGYTDTAIGCAALFGFHFPENFRRPYLSTSITEFWRRWHISLSRWLRDYLYIPLGGNRYGAWRTYRNLMVTMLLGGLWHGASWNFVIWGGYHGVLLSIERILGVQPGIGIKQPIRMAVTFLLVCVGWVFFRAATTGEAVWILQQLGSGVGGKFPFSPWESRMALATAGLALAEERWGWFERLVRLPGLGFAAVVAVMLLSLELFGVTDVNIPFIYFQF
ncbi:MAG: MBOAT family O-acyltransferase [Bryobacteraceae bacterium]